MLLTFDDEFVLAEMTQVLYELCRAPKNKERHRKRKKSKSRLQKSVILVLVLRRCARRVFCAAFTGCSRVTAEMDLSCVCA